MKCVFLVCLLLQAVYATKNITLSINTPQENPADVSYVEGKAPEELKAGPAKTIKAEPIAQGAFIRSSNREIPKDDEIENEEFERFIQKYHSRPTIETVFVSTSPSPPAEDSEELNEETVTSEPQAEVFKQPSAKLQTFERSVAHPTLSSHILSPPDHQPGYAIINHQPHDASLHNGGSVSFGGSDGYVFQSNGGNIGNEGLILQSNGGNGYQILNGHGGNGGNGYQILNGHGRNGGNGLQILDGHGQYLLTDSQGINGEQQYYQYANLLPRTFNVAQNAVKTRTYEIRRPAIQKHYYDIEERVIVRPAGSVIVELDRPVAKVPTGETVVALGGLQGTYAGDSFQQSSQGGLSFSNAFGVNRGGSQGGLVGIGIHQSTSGAYDSSQGGLSGSGVTYASSIGLPSYNGVVGGFQQSQGAIGSTQGGIGFQQSQGGIAFSTTTQSPISSPTSTVVIGTQQSQGAVGVSKNGVSTTGFQQSQSGVVVTSTTPAPRVTQTSSTATTLIGGSTGSGGVYSTTGAPFFQSTTPAPNFGGFQQSQGGIGISQGGGIIGGGFQQSQGGVYSTTPARYLPPPAPTSTVLLSGSKTVIGGSTGSGGVYSTTGAPFFQSTTPATNFGGFQQSQGGIGISQSGGIIGGGFQQSQGGVYSTTPAAYLPPPAPTPTVLIGGSNKGFLGAGGIQGNFNGAGFQQSQGGIGLSNDGGFAGFQQSQGGIGISQGGISGAGFQQSQGGIGLLQGGSYGGREIIYSTTASPSYSFDGSRSILLKSLQNGGSYPSVSTTTGGPIFVSTQIPIGNNANNVVFKANSNVQSRESVSSTTTTERSFSQSQDASAIASGSSSGSVQSVSKNITPYMIAVGEPDFSYPPYVEITSNGSPLGHLQQPYARVRASSQDYPRMRYQGKLLTGEVQIDDGLAQPQDYQQKGYGALSSQHQNYENPAYVAEIPTNFPQEEQPDSTVHRSGFSHNQQPDEAQYQQQFVGSSKQPTQVSQISSSAHQQPPQIYQQHFLRATSQPIVIRENNDEQHAAQQQTIQQHAVQQQAVPQHSARPHAAQQYFVLTPINQQHSAHQAISHQQPNHHNLVAQIRHQQLNSQEPVEVHSYHQQTNRQPTESTHAKLLKEALEEPLEVSEMYSSTHQQPTLYQEQVASTAHTLEPYNSGQRLYKQRGAPSKYTQDQSLNAAPTSEHTVYFNNNLEHTSARNQNLEIPPEPESKIEATSAKSIESSTSQRVEESTQPQRQTYASVLAQGKPGILYAPPKPSNSHHSPGHKQHFLRFSSDGSSLFTPSGRELHLVYSQPPQRVYSHQSHTHSIPAAPIEPAQQQISVSNKGVQIQAQLPITRQSQIELSASDKPAQAIDPQITRSQSHAAESHQTSAHYEGISSTTPETTTTKEHRKLRGPQKYRNEQTHGAITLRSGRTYGDQRVIASTPAPSDGGAASESVQTRRIVVNHPFQTVQEVVEREPVTNIHQVTLNASAKQVYHGDGGLQQGQQKAAAYRTPAPYKVAALLNHPEATLSFQRSG